VNTKNKPTKKVTNYGNLTKRTSELHESYKFQEKMALAFLVCWEECRKDFNFCWRSKAIAEPKSAPQKIKLWGGATRKRGILSRF